MFLFFLVLHNLTVKSGVIFRNRSSLGSVRLVLLCFYSTSIMFILQQGPGCKINWYEKTELV